MPTWTSDEFRAYQDRRARLRAAEPERAAGKALGGSDAGETPDGQVPRGRLAIRFDVWSVRPLDWDNYFLKPMQDCCVHAGLLPDDDWQSLEGHVASHKAHSREEERTEITIQELPCQTTTGHS